MNEMLLRVQDRLDREFFHPRYAFYTDLPLSESDLFFPTEQEVRDCLPCPTGWMSGVEDGALNTALNLEAQALGFLRTGDAHYVQRGRRLLNGLLRLATCGTRGFLARSICNDQGLHYPYSSVDQYTLGVFGLWRVFHTQIPTPEQKNQIVRVLGDIADKFYREKGEITADNGRPEHQFTQGGPRDRLPGVERTMEAFLGAYSASGDSRYLDYQRQWRDDPTQTPVHELLTGWEPGKMIQTYALWQTQCALRLVWEVEPNPQLRSACEQTMRKISDLCLPQLMRHRLRCDSLLAGRDNVGWRACYRNFEGWSNLKELMGLTYYYYHCHPIQGHENEFVVNPLLAAHSITLNPSPPAPQTRAQVESALSRFPVESCRLSHSLVLFESVYQQLQLWR